MSLCNSASAKNKRPESNYISISEDQMKRLMRKWVGISPEKARDVFMETVGFKPSYRGDQDDETGRLSIYV